MKKFLLAGVAIAALGNIASAADMAVKAPYRAPPPPVVDWTGFYIGAHAGYGWGRDDFTTTDSFTLLTVTGPKSKGGVYGFQAGYNQQWGAWVGGLEIDASGTAIKGTNVFATGLHPCVGSPTLTCSNSESLQDKFDMLGTVRARVGFLAWPNVLFYGTGGLAWTRFVQTFDSTSTESFPGVFNLTSASHSSNPSWRFGWSAGAGVEGMIWSNWLLRVEYLHYDFGNSGDSAFSSTFTVTGSPTSVSSSSFTSSNLTVDVVRVGLSYKFGGYGGPGYGGPGRAY